MDEGSFLLPLHLNDTPLPLPTLNPAEKLKQTRAEKILNMEKETSAR